MAREMSYRGGMVVTELENRKSVMDSTSVKVVVTVDVESEV